MSRVVRAGALAAILLGCSCLPAATYQEGDFQIWHTEAQDITIVKGAKAAFEQEFRYWNDSTELHYQHYDFGLVLSPNKYFDLGLFYRQIYERRKTGSKFLPEECPNINATIKYDLWGFMLKDRNRFEYRIFDYQDSNCRYRNKVTLKLPWTVTPWKIRPYFADEIFVRIDDNMVFNQNRFTAGLGMEFCRSIKGEVYYLLKSDRGRTKWTDANILGLKLKVAF